MGDPAGAVLPDGCCCCCADISLMLHPGKDVWQVSPGAQSSLPLGQCVDGEQSAIASPHVLPQNWVSDDCRLRPCA